MIYRLYELTVDTASGSNTLFAALTDPEIRSVSSIDPAHLANRVLLTIAGTPSEEDRTKAHEIFRRSYASHTGLRLNA